MDIEQLNKSQIVLLTLLVSFVTSIATGIVTVALMQQAPPAITQTVNRVVEHTVEKIVPGQSAAAGAPLTQTQTIVVKEGDVVASAVSTAAPAIVRLYASSGDTPQLLGMGVVIAPGVIATDIGALGDASDAFIETSVSNRIRAFVIQRVAGTGIAFLRAATTTPDGAPVPAWKPVSYPTKQFVLGQTVVALSGKTTLRLGQGIVAGAQDLDKSAGSQFIDTNISANSIMPGSVLIDSDGNLLGMSTQVSRAQGDSMFVSQQAVTMKDSVGGQQ